MKLPFDPRIVALAAMLALAGGAAACSDDQVLAPPDGVACTRGTIAVGDTVHGTITDESCIQYSNYQYWEARAESWTLRAKPNTAYVVRLEPVEDDEEFYGLLAAYARNAQGDVTFATSDSYAFREDERGREMFLVSDRAQELSLRVEVIPYFGGYGDYRLVVESCPVTILEVGDDASGIAVGDGCLSEGFDSRHRTRVRFLGFRMQIDSSYDVSVERTAGAAPLVGALMGPDLDLAESTDGSLYIRTVNDLPAFGFESYPYRTGLYTLAIAIPANGNATVRAELTGGVAALTALARSTR